MKIKLDYNNDKNNDNKKTNNKNNKIQNLNKKNYSKSRESLDINKKTADNNAINELKQLVGLNNVFEMIDEITAFIKVQRKRREENLAAEPMVLHMIFKGNPGTGKTTVARLIGKVFKEIGFLQKGHLVEVERADLVGEYVGHTAQKTREQIKKSLGGILFIDEAYSLARGGSRDFGKEAIDLLVKSMEDYKDDFILILAGYKDEMDQFLNSNPGLRSRFPIHLDFPDYSLEELVDIGNIMFKEREYFLTKEAEMKLETTIRNALSFGHKYDGNARLVRNIVEKSIRAQAKRIIKSDILSRRQLIFIEACDITAYHYKMEKDNNIVAVYEADRQNVTSAGG